MVEGKLSDRIGFSQAKQFRLLELLFWLGLVKVNVKFICKLYGRALAKELFSTLNGGCAGVGPILLHLKTLDFSKVLLNFTS